MMHHATAQSADNYVQEIYLSLQNYQDGQAHIHVPSGMRIRVINPAHSAVQRVVCVVEDNGYLELIAEHVMNASTSISYVCTLKRDAQLQYEGVVYGAGSADYHLSVACEQEGANASISLGYALHKDAQLAIRTFQHHQAPHTSSTLICKGIAAQESYASYDGMIRIEEGARQVSAAQENKTLVIGDRARAVSIPNIEVLANDVQCTHASAVGRHDDEISAYLSSRGLTTSEAQSLLLDAFLADVVEQEVMRERLVQLANGKAQV